MYRNRGNERARELEQNCANPGCRNNAVPKMGRSTAFCSKQCLEAYERLDQDMTDTVHVEYCGWCGVPIGIQYWDKEQTDYCSQECHTKAVRNGKA